MHKIDRPPTAPLFRHGGAAGGRSVLDFSASLNPLGPPPSVVRALLRELKYGDQIARYPAPYGRALRERLAHAHGVGPRQVVVGNGASELIGALPRAVGARRVAIVEPTYTEYLRASLLEGAEVTHWLPEDDTFAATPFDPEGADLVWLCNPNNPTGRLWPPGVLAPWISAHPAKVFVVDESFLPFRADEAEHSLVPALPRLPNLVVVRSLTKVCALAGLRLGYAVAGPERAERLRAHLPPWSVNALAQAAGLVVLEDAEFLAETHSWLAQTRPVFLERLRASSACIEPLPSEANFVLLRLKEGTAARLARRLGERGIAVRDASNFVGLGPGYVRVAVRLDEDNRRLCDELRSLFREA